MEPKDDGGISLRAHKDSLTKNRTRLLLQARVLEIQEKLVQLDIDRVDHGKELAKAQDALAKLDK